jgi:methylglutaconyl-CoA hydratase
MEFVEFEIKERVGYIILNRPDKRNALNAQFVEELKTTFRAAESNEAVKVIVLKANGDAFCAGADLGYLKSLQSNSYEENLADSTALMELFQMIYSLNKVVIAQVEGHAIAGGCGLATVCDFVFSVPAVKFGYTEVKIGFIPAIVSIFLLRKIGEAKSKELLISGHLIDSSVAHNFGLVNYISPLVEIDEKVFIFAQKLCLENSSQSMEMTKKLISDVQHLSISEGLKLAAAQNAKARETEDCKSGITAFLNKEKITW